MFVLFDILSQWVWIAEFAFYIVGIIAFIKYIKS